MKDRQKKLHPKVSVIVSIYDDCKALDLIIKSLLTQTKIPDEIIISEDGQNDKIKQYIKNLNHKALVHLRQKDLGWRKNRALNRAILKSSGDYLIFIDGDCIPYKNFVESHLELSKKDTVLCGRRFELGYKMSEKLRNNKLSFDSLVKFYLFKIPFFIADQSKNIEDGFNVNPNSWLWKFIIFLRKNREVRLLGCNFSGDKSLFLAVNGFDEDFTEPGFGEDSDIQRRFNELGVSFKSCKFATNILHLYHPPQTQNKLNLSKLTYMSRPKGHQCRNGIKKL